MKFKALLPDGEHVIQLDHVENSAKASVDGRAYEFDIVALAAGEYLLKIGSEIFRCRVAARRDSQNSFVVDVRGSTHDVTIVDPKRLRSAQSSAAHGHGEAQIISPMPGKVVRVLVEQGATVDAGAGIVVVEAMKMQNEMKTPKAGVVVSLKAEVGATVNAGDVLAVIE